MGNLLQMSITSGQDTDSRQFTLAANSHRLAGETYDANGNRTSGSADGFTSVSYNILNLPETVTAGGWTINYLYSAAGAKLRERVILSDPPVILSASEESVTDYAGNTVFRDSVLHKVLTGSGYLETTDSLQTLLSHPGYRFFITDHLGSVRVVADAQGNVLQRNVYHPYGEDYAAVYARGGNILDGLNIGSNAQPGGEGTPEGEGEPEIGEPEPGTPVGGGGPDDPIEDDGEEATAEEAPLAWPQYYRSFNPYRFSSKEQMTVYGGSLVGSNFEPNAGLYDFGARWYAPYSARWSTPDPLSEKYYAISPYAYCAGNPVNLVDPEGMDIWELQRDGQVIRKEKSDSNVLYAVDIHGNRGDSMVFSSEDILLQLEKKDKNKEIRSIDFSGKRKTDAIGLFLFLADNTSFEWAVHIGKDGTVVGTRYDETNAGYWGDYGLTEVPILSIHSHPGEYGFKYGFYGETGDMEGDQQRMSKNPNAKADMYYIYFPGSKNTYQICKKDYEIKEVPKGLEKYRKRKI